MARFARVMLEEMPFHLTHRGNHRKRVFHTNNDRQIYVGLLDRFAKNFGMSIWAYCLMDNHVHLIAVGKKRNSISMALGNTHRACSRSRNRQTGPFRDILAIGGLGSEPAWRNKPPSA